MASDKRSAYPAVILSVAKNLIQYSSAPAIASIALCFRADPAVRSVSASLRLRLRRRDPDAGARMRFFVAKGAPQNDGGLARVRTRWLFDSLDYFA
jgi:hypothetical protein